MGEQAGTEKDWNGKKMKRGNKEFSKEDGEIREDQPQDDDREHLERYADKFYDQSPSPGFSVFGRPLLLGGCSGVGGTYGFNDLEIVRNEGADDGARGKVVAGVSLADGEVVEEDDRSEEEGQNESTGNERYDSWESSCLAKFSEVLGFPTKGFEKEILELLRNLVASLRMVAKPSIYRFLQFRPGFEIKGP